jgi:hypothetical protein
MRLAELQQKLIAAARVDPPADRVPYAFEKRVLARLQARPLEDFRLLWARALWRGAVACLGLALLLGVFTLVAPPAAPAGDLSQDFENTLIAAVDQDNNDYTW